MTILDLFRLIESDDLESLSRLISREVINEKSPGGITMLHKAVISRKSRICEFLIENGADVEIQDERGMNVFHYLGFQNFKEVSDLVLDSCRNWETRDAAGNTPLWYAVFGARGEYVLVRKLVARGANPMNRNQNNKTPLEIAETIRDQELVAILRSGGRSVQ